MYDLMSFKRCAFLVMFVLISVKTIWAQEPQSSVQGKKYEYGFSTGVLFPGDINISESDNDFRKKRSTLFKGFIDSYLIPNFAVGLSLQYSRAELEEKSSYWTIEPYYENGDWYFENVKIEEINIHNVSVFEIGGSLKTRFFLNPKFVLKPGLTISYRKFYFDYTANCGLEFDDAAGLGVNGSLEIQYLYSNRIILFSEIGAISQPYGGKQDITYLDFGPILYVNIGVAL